MFKYTFKKNTIENHTFNVFLKKYIISTLVINVCLIIFLINMLMTIMR